MELSAEIDCLQFYQTFLNNPTLAAACLAYGDKLGLETTADVAHCIVLGCYGNNIMTDDHKHLLEVCLYAIYDKILEAYQSIY